LFVAPKSYTGENVVEVSCHGSNYILQKVIQLFIKKGARSAQPGEFTMRAFLNGRMDLSQAEAVADLIASDSAVSHQMAMNQMRGGISNEIEKLREELINFASLIELELDFGEEDVEFANRDDLRQLILKIQGFISSLLSSFDLGNAIKQGVLTVIAGRPNAGKSTLLNAMLNEERAIVSDIAGTTRDTIEEVLNINGVQFRLIDTAGIRDAQDQIEAIGVEKTMQKVMQASLLLYVFDVTGMTLEEVEQDLNRLHRDEMTTIVVCNKMDRNPYFDPEKLKTLLANGQQPTANSQIISLSAKNGMNVPYLKEVLYNAVLEDKNFSDNTIVSNARHFEALQKTSESLDRVLEGMDNAITGDFLAMDIRKALYHLGEITGKVDVEELLGNIFGKFCIGK
ncbi:MAG: tRNA uridine-5-carboxymethylaminomethyl(34) synthesis GTPase MnmE, partial [Saprospiraceae bacterium]|nr:tRNA uridine-5-carboxymethylaminomethyl(34) synthesis GTPase MnmE [Saprospiraceae bacterium]